MPRIQGVDIPNEKRIEIALTYVRGVGRTLSNEFLKKAKINPDTRAKELTDAQIASLNKIISESGNPVEGELRRIVSQNIRRLVDIKSYRGSRHAKGLPARGQKTSSNARTRKGKRKTVGGLKQKITKK